MFMSDFAICLIVDTRSAVSANALVRFWIAVSVSAFMCAPLSLFWGSCRSSGTRRAPCSSRALGVSRRAPGRWPHHHQDAGHDLVAGLAPRFLARVARNSRRNAGVWQVTVSELPLNTLAKSPGG